jgi:hypothetical protein
MALVISATHPAAVAGSIHGSAYAGTPDTHRWFLDLRATDPRTGDAYRVGCWFCASYDVAQARARTHCSRHYRNTARVVIVAASSPVSTTPLPPSPRNERRSSTPRRSHLPPTSDRHTKGTPRWHGTNGPRSEPARTLTPFWRSVRPSTTTRWLSASSKAKRGHQLRSAKRSPLEHRSMMGSLSTSRVHGKPHSTLEKWHGSTSSLTPA